MQVKNIGQYHNFVTLLTPILLDLNKVAVTILSIMYEKFMFVIKAMIL